ncbi:MAG TPA: SAM-dependent methyltransferase [Methylococcaceae bacterium]|nr:SAM-dependent methyltransferase [Methylococcaceae bacterium]
MSENYDALFSGIIGQDYDMLNLICPQATKMSHLVGEALGDYASRKPSETLNVIELGGGTGITTLALLRSASNTRLLSVDNEPVMQNQAKQTLNSWVETGQLTFSSVDALSALHYLPGASVDVIASAYTLHNFTNDYRRDVITEIYRVLKPGGKFINGDRYALDNVSLHTKNTQEEVAGYFRVLVAENKLDLLEHWIIHLFNDESENHIMRETPALEALQEAGFIAINLSYRHGVNALVFATKP